MTEDSDPIKSEIEAKLEILRKRAHQYQEFIAPPDQPPLLWQMAMLADAGFTVLPPVCDPNPDRSFPEMTVAMTEVNWGDEYYCLVGGAGFAVMAVPPSYHGHLLRPKPMTAPVYYMPATIESLPMTIEVEQFRRRDLALGRGWDVRWRSRIMVCVGSHADRRIPEWPRSR